MCCKKNIKETESPKGFVKQYFCILWNEVLNPIEKMYLSLIISFKKEGKDFLCCNDYVCQRLGISESTLNRTKITLISKGLIRREEHSGYSNSIILEKENLAEFLGCDLFSTSEEPKEQKPKEQEPITLEPVDTKNWEEIKRRKKFTPEQWERLQYYDNKFKELHPNIYEKK